MKVQGIVESVQYSDQHVNINYTLLIDGTNLGQRNAGAEVFKVHGTEANTTRPVIDVERFVKAALVEQFPNATGVEIARRKPAPSLARPADSLEVVEV